MGIGPHSTDRARAVVFREVPKETECRCWPFYASIKYERNLRHLRITISTAIVSALPPVHIRIRVHVLVLIALLIPDYRKAIEVIYLQNMQMRLAELFILLENLISSALAQSPHSRSSACPQRSHSSGHILVHHNPDFSKQSVIFLVYG